MAPEELGRLRAVMQSAEREYVLAKEAYELAVASRACVGCGMTFDSRINRVPYQLADRPFCSVECRNEYRREKINTYQRERKARLRAAAAQAVE